MDDESECFVTAQISTKKNFASKMAAVKKVGQKNGEVRLLVEYLFCHRGDRLTGVGTVGGAHGVTSFCAPS